MPLLYFLPPLGAVLIWSGNMTINQLTVGSIAFHVLGGALVLAGVIMTQTLTRPLGRPPARTTRLDRGPG